MAHLVKFNSLNPANLQSWASKSFDNSVHINEDSDVNNHGVREENNTSVVNVWSASQNIHPGDKIDDIAKSVDPVGNGQRINNNRQPITVSWKNISLSVKGGKEILKDLNGKVSPGELTALMGPSGAGKTTLLNILSGFTKNYSGKVLVNGSDRDTNSFRNLSCYVVQESHVLSYLTVQESVSMAAALKLPNTMDKEEKKALVEKTLISLGISESRNTRAGNLSGGQKKRLCIAQEIVNNQPIIFLDEPTSGLDSSSCMQCIKLLKSLADEGRTVVCTIHQPSARIFELFDKLYLLAEGECMYRGPTQNLIGFLNEQGLDCPQYHSLSDFVIEVVMGEHGDWNRKLKEATDKKDSYEEDEERISQKSQSLLEKRNSTAFESSTMSIVPSGDKKGKFSENVWFKNVFKNTDKKEYPTSLSHQFRVLTYRNFINSLRNPVVTHVQILMYILTAIFIGSMFYGIGTDASKMQDNAGFIFFCIMFTLLGTKAASVITFPMERIVIAREYLNNWYDVRAYLLARTVTELPYQIILQAIFSSIVYWMTFQPPELWRFTLFTLMLIITAFVAQSLSLIVGSIFDQQTAVYMASALSIPIAVFGGFFVTFDTMPVYLRWLSYLSYVRYMFQAACLTIYGSGRKITECSKLFCRKPKQFLDYFTVHESEVYIYFLVPLLFALVFKIISYYIIRRKFNSYHNS